VVLAAANLQPLLLSGVVGHVFRQFWQHIHGKQLGLHRHLAAKKFSLGLGHLIARPAWG
jgi:hypothetical protein